MSKLEVKDRPTIKLLPISVDYNPDALDSRAQFEADTYGKYPFISYRGMTIEAQNINYLKLYNDKFLPYLEMEFRDMTGRMIDDYFPLDDAIISFFMRPVSEKLMPIRMDFKITKFVANKKDEGYENLVYNIIAELNIDDLYYRKWESYGGTSYKVLRQMAKEMQLGFVSNIEDSDDNMKWINTFMAKRDFIRYITSHSYKSDESFLWSYIDFYYNLSYVDIETQMQQDISKQGNYTSYSSIISDGTDKVSKLVLNNNPDSDNPDSNVYIKRYVLENTTTQLNIELGYKHRIHYYNDSDTNYNSTYLDSISDTGNNANIVLKGNPERPDSKFSESVFGQSYMGKMDSSVVHKNFLYAEKQNLNNIEFLQKIKMKIVLNKPNFNIYRFQKVEVELFKMAQIMQGDEDKTQVLDNTQLKPPGATERNWKINNRLSGQWLVTGINYVFDNQKGNVQEITLVKRELGTEYLKK